MKITANIVGALALAAVAFAVGRSGLVAQGDSAVAGPPEETEISAEMMKMMELGQPGPHHKHLDLMVGNWEGHVRMWMQPGTEPMQAPVTIKREWILGNRYIKESVESVSDWGEFHGLGFVGYNNLEGQFESVWLDSDSTWIVKEPGTYDPSAKLMTFRGTHRDPATGHMTSTWSKIDLSDPNRQTMAGYKVGADGKEFKHFEGVFERIRK